MKLRFVELDTETIFNRLAPENATAWNWLPEYRDVWWDSNVVEIRKYFAEVWTAEMDYLTNHFK